MAYTKKQKEYIKEQKAKRFNKKGSSLFFPILLLLVVGVVGTVLLYNYFYSSDYETVHSFANLIAEDEVDDNPQRYINGDDIRGMGFNNLDQTLTTQGFELLDIVCNQNSRPIFDGVYDELEESYNQAIKILDRFITNDMTDEEKILAIHDYLVYHVEYDYELYNNYLDGNSTSESSSFELTGVFLEKVAVCDGYSKAFMLMCGIEGINAVYVRGTSSRDGKVVMHAWNKVKLNDEWYNVDVTLDKYLFVVTDADTIPVLNHGMYLKSDTTYSLYGEYVEYSADDQLFIVPVTNDVDYDYYSNRQIDYLNNNSYTVKSSDELVSLFLAVKSAEKAVGAIEVKLDFYTSRTKANTESEYSVAIQNAYLAVTNSNFNYKIGDEAPPYAFYPDGVFVFLIYV